MDIERFKKISDAKIKAGKMINRIQDEIKQYKHSKQDMQIDLKEMFQPIIKAQEETKKTIDEKQDKLIEQLEKNQTMKKKTKTTTEKTTKLPLDYKPSMLESDMDTGFDIDEIKKLTEYKLAQPSEVCCICCW